VRPFGRLADRFSLKVRAVADSKDSIEKERVLDEPHEPRATAASDPDFDAAGLSDADRSLLRQAGESYRQGLHEPRAWHAFRSRRSRRRAGFRYSVLVAGAAAVAAFALLRQAGEPEVPLPAIAVAPELRARASLEETPAAPVPSVRTSPRAAPMESPPPVRSPPSRPPPSPATEGGCRTRVEAGQFAAGRACFGQLAQRTGLEADVALLEQARLSIQHLSDVAGGLELLDRHRARFPESPLRGEAAELRVHALFALGRAPQALVESENLLGAPWARDLAPELHWLRGRIYEEELGDCARAANEYLALLGEPGGRGDQAELRRAQCLERIGRARDAEQAFRRYLDRDSPQSADLARAALERLDLGE
jgi:hypothetical protein